MASIVIVSKHLFLNENGRDLELPTGYGDCVVFSNMKKAEDYVVDVISKYNLYTTEPEFDRYEYGKNFCSTQGAEAIITYSQVDYNTNGIRTTFKLIERIVE